MKEIILKYIDFKTQDKWDGSFTEEQFLEMFIKEHGEEISEIMWQFFREGYKRVIKREDFDLRIMGSVSSDIDICYKSNEPCKHNCSGLCRESV